MIGGPPSLENKLHSFFQSNPHLLLPFRVAWREQDVGGGADDQRQDSRCQAQFGWPGRQPGF